ncbi:MAG: CDP-2,3-bis-(O-geranylgeranyl)-sn-glycerol synthase [Promethearchaeota archaeon]
MIVDLMYLIINALIFIFPAFVANAAPTILGRGKRLNAPIDCGKYWKDNKRILGDGKTIRGFISGVVCGMMSCVGIFVITNFSGYSLEYINYFQSSILYWAIHKLGNNYIILCALIGFLLGSGALIGDIIGSFIKRRSGLQRGESFPFMDQLGFLVVALVFVFPVIPWPLVWLLVLAPSTLGLHIGLNILSYVVGIQEVPL